MGHKNKDHLDKHFYDNIREKELRLLCEQQRSVLNLFKDTVRVKTQYAGMLEDIIVSKDDQIYKLKEIIVEYENIINSKLKNI